MATITTNNVRFLIKNDTAARWATSELILMKGEPALESDTGKFKFGDGVHKFSEILNYAGVITESSLQNGYIKIDGQEIKVYELPTATKTAIGGIKAADTITGGDYATGAVQIDANGVGSVAKVAEAEKLETAKTIYIDGDATGNAQFDGSSDTTITVTLANNVNNLDTAKYYAAVKVNGKGQVVDGSETITVAKISDAGTAASLNGGTSAGNVPVLDANGKLETTILPALALGDTEIVANDTARFALTTAKVQKGDVVIVTGTNKTYRVIDDTKLDVEAGYTQILTPDAPVQSVNGKVGVVTLNTDDVGEGQTNLYYTNARFDARFAASDSTDLSDGAHILHDTDTLVFDGGNASISGGGEG
jgi:hypothetical protein